MITTNTGAKKIEDSDLWVEIFDAHNDSVDAFNQRLAKHEANMGIVETGNAASQAIDAGEFVTWNGDLYTADSNISSGATLSASGGSKNLTPCSKGGFNLLNNNIINLFDTKYQMKSHAASGATVTVPSGRLGFAITYNTIIGRTPTGWVFASNGDIIYSYDIFMEGSTQISIDSRAHTASFTAVNGSFITLFAYV